MISIDNEGEVSIVDNTHREQTAEVSETENDDYIEVDGWQWIIIIFGILFFLLLINASFANYRY